jgi:hypothetical protein
MSRGDLAFEELMRYALIGDRNTEQLERVAPALFAGLPKSHMLPAAICAWAPRRRAEWWALKAGKLDGGLARSLVLRRKLLKSSGVVLGAWSQGPGLIAGAFPPNSIIGRYCSIGPGVMVANENHPLDQYSTSGWFYDPICRLVAERALPPRPILAIGHDVWIGASVCITPRVRRIGHGAVIGAGSVVTRDVPPLAIVAGNPARLLRYRFEGATAQSWLASRWWRLEPAKALASFPSMSHEVNPAPQPVRWPDALEASERAFDALVTA